MLAAFAEDEAAVETLKKFAALVDEDKVTGVVAVLEFGDNNLARLRSVRVSVP